MRPEEVEVKMEAVAWSSVRRMLSVATKIILIRS
jgi:hypothetical protein